MVRSEAVFYMYMGFETNQFDEILNTHLPSILYSFVLLTTTKTFEKKHTLALKREAQQIQIVGLEG
jgi:hypothetical protein